ncbi:MAG: asparagine synthase-related protein, partial [Acidobacteriota bacterium]
MRWGDWLLVDDGVEPPPERRSGPWAVARRLGGRTLYKAPPAGGVGTPVREIAAPGGALWLFGDSALGDADVARVAWDGDASAIGGRFLLLTCRDGVFEVVTDRFNTIHAYAVDGGRVASSSFLAASALSRRRLDWPALVSFFACGFFLGEGTHWRDVRCLGPARRHRLSGASEAGRSERYWRWRHAPEASRSAPETVEAFAEVFDRSVGDAVQGGGVALPLSGGLDSRALCAAAPASSLAWSFGYGYQSGSVEVAIAEQLARARGLPFTGFVIEPYLHREIDRGFDLLEGFQDLTQTRQLAVADALGERAGWVLAGHWGDVWLDDMGLGAVDGGDAPAVLARALGKLRKRGRGWLLEHLCAPALGVDPEALLEAQVADALEPYGDLDEADFRLKAFKTDHWSARWTLASVRAYQASA